MKILAILLASVALASAENTSGVDQFFNMITCLGKLSTWQGLMYADYGCFCGKGSIGNTPVDATDRCCQIHDNCYGDATLNDVGCGSLDTYLIQYDYTQTSARGKCGIECKAAADYPANDSKANCKAFLCQCDLKAAQCFANERGSFTMDHFNYQGCVE